MFSSAADANRTPRSSATPASRLPRLDDDSMLYSRADDGRRATVSVLSVRSEGARETFAEAMGDKVELDSRRVDGRDGGAGSGVYAGEGPRSSLPNLRVA
jgi:hypothetical protein